MRMIIPFSSSFVNFTRRWKSRPGILSSWDLLRNEMRIQTDIEIHLSVPGVNKMPCYLQCLVSVQPLTFSSGRPPLLLINLSLLFTIMIINELKCHSFIRQLDQSHRYSLCSPISQCRIEGRSRAVNRNLHSCWRGSGIPFVYHHQT